MSTLPSARPIVVFDGECALCNGFIAWLLRADRHGRLLILGSDSEPGREILRRAGLTLEDADESSLIWDGQRALRRSDGLFEILAQLPYPWRLAVGIRWVPRRVRDAVYRAIASRRPKIKAEDPACGVPPRALVALWRSRLATMADVEALGFPPAHRS